VNCSITAKTRDKKHKAQYSSHYKNNAKRLLDFEGDARDRLDLEPMFATFYVNK
jgi:hypothetical protein